jgi:Phosphodiester glycosidase
MRTNATAAEGEKTLLNVRQLLGGLLATALLWLSAPQIASTVQPEPPLAHAPQSVRFAGGKPVRMHRFRIRLAEVRAEITDLGFKLPVNVSLGSALLAMNGGYWEWHLGKPRMMGYVVSQGKQLSPVRKKLDGGTLIVQQARARILASSQLPATPADVEWAVQCKPRLVQAGKVVANLSAQGHTARTAVCIRDGGHTLDAYLSDPADRGPTLAELGDWLAAEGCVDALNLDGGPSTAAAFRRENGVLNIGTGVHLPYSIRFFPR